MFSLNLYSKHLIFSYLAIIFCEKQHRVMVHFCGGKTIVTNSLDGTLKFIVIILKAYKSLSEIFTYSDYNENINLILFITILPFILTLWLTRFLLEIYIQCYSGYFYLVILFGANMQGIIRLQIIKMLIYCIYCIC